MFRSVIDSTLRATVPPLPNRPNAPHNPSLAIQDASDQDFRTDVDFDNVNMEAHNTSPGHDEISADEFEDSGEHDVLI